MSNQLLLGILNFRKATKFLPGTCSFWACKIIKWLHETIADHNYFEHYFKVGPSPSKFFCLFAYIIALQKKWKMLYLKKYFILKALFVLKIFEFLFWLFGHVEKMAWLER